MEDAAATALKSFDANSLQKLLTQSGPTCKCVFVPCEAEASVAAGSSGSSSSSSTSSSKTGVPVEVSLDMTPKVCAPALQLGGSATICASYDDIDVIVMKLREPAENTPVNPHKLPAPFQEFVVKGPILFVRMDQNSEPKDFSLEEYVAYAKKIALNPPAPMKDLEEEDEEGAGDGEEDEEEDEESDGDENDDYWQHVVDRVVAIFKESKGRDPTEEELKVLLEQLNQGREAMEGDDDVDEEEEAAEDADAPDGQGEAVDVSTMIRSKLTEVLTTKLGRSPTEDELNEVLEDFSNDESLHSPLLEAQNAGSVETRKVTETAGASVDTGASETANASAEASAPADLAAMIRLKLTEALTVQLGRAPTEEELNEMMEQLSQDESFHSSLLAVPSSAGSAPTPTNNKKRPSDFDGKSTPAVEQNPSKRARKEVSPDSITAAVK